MRIYLKELPKTGSVKIVDEGNNTWSMSRYEIKEDLNIIVTLRDAEATVHLDHAGKRWHIDVEKYEYHPNIRVVLTGTEVMLEPGKEAPTFLVRG